MEERYRIEGSIMGFGFKNERLMGSPCLTGWKTLTVRATAHRQPHELFNADDLNPKP